MKTTYCRNGIHPLLRPCAGKRATGKTRVPGGFLPDPSADRVLRLCRDVADLHTADPESGT
jgi:hypothetical protein